MTFIVINIHAVFGSLALFSAVVAFLAPKGFTLHRLSGKVFVGSMVSMALAGVVLAYLKERPESIISGLIVSYLVITSWATILRRAGHTGLFERIALVSIIAIAGIALFFGVKVLKGAVYPNSGFSAAFYFVEMGLSIFFASLDLRVILKGGVASTRRIRRHIWRMCLALFITVAALLGNPQIFSGEIRDSVFFPAPIFAIVLIYAYWMLRIQFSHHYKTA